jgi:Arm DNA-binding domain
MGTVTLTARYLDQLKPQRRRYEVFDALVPGFAIRVTPAGHKSFTLYYRHHGRPRRVGLGRYPDVLLADARVQGNGAGAHQAGPQIPEGTPPWRRGISPGRRSRYWKSDSARLHQCDDWVEELSRVTKRPTKSLMRMFGPDGNPHARNLFEVIGHLQRAEGLQFELSIKAAS